jgi:hypothetical protein
LGNKGPGGALSDREYDAAFKKYAEQSSEQSRKESSAPMDLSPGATNRGTQSFLETIPEHMSRALVGTLSQYLGVLGDKSPISILEKGKGGAPVELKEFLDSVKSLLRDTNSVQRLGPANVEVIQSIMNSIGPSNPIVGAVREVNQQTTAAGDAGKVRATAQATTSASHSHLVTQTAATGNPVQFICAECTRHLTVELERRMGHATAVAGAAP